MKKVDESTALFGIAGVFLAAGIACSNAVGFGNETSDVALLAPMTLFLVSFGALLVLLSRMSGNFIHFIFPPRGGRVPAIKKQTPPDVRGRFFSFF